MTALLLILLGAVPDPGGSLQPPARRLASFPLPVEPAAAPAETAPSVLLFPLDAHVDTMTLTSAENGVAFDIDGDGDLDRVAWPEAGRDVAFLALDVNRDRRITSGTEIIGSHTVPGAMNGCNALIRVFAATGAPLSGAVREGHQLYEELLLWVDRNHNGVSEPREIRPAKNEFTAIGMGYTKIRGRDAHGNRVRFEGWADRRVEPRRAHYYEVVLTNR